MVAEALGALFALAALALFFFLPGFVWVRALWPEKRFRGPEAVENVVEGLTAGFLLSLALTILIGFGLGNGPGTFQAAPSDPLLETILAILTAGGLAAGWLRGGWGPHSTAGGAEPSSPPEDLEGTISRFEDMEAEERELSRALKGSRGAGEASGLRQRLADLRARRRAAEQQRQQEFQP